jgi:hypothetical protein
MRAIDGIKANAMSRLAPALCTGSRRRRYCREPMIGGTGVVVKTAPKVTVDDMVTANPSGMKVAFGRTPPRLRRRVQEDAEHPHGCSSLMREWLNKAPSTRRRRSPTQQKDPINA